MLKLGTRVNCVECQYIHMPNPGEEIFLCLRTMEKIVHEIDESIQCRGFEEIQINWAPKYVEQLGNYE